MWRILRQDGFYFVQKKFLFYWRTHCWTFTESQAREYINEQNKKKTKSVGGVSKASTKRDATHMVKIQKTFKKVFNKNV